MNTEEAIRWTLGDLGRFSRYATPRELRPYQVAVGRAVARSVLRGEGKTFTVLMSRQAGKNETSAQLEAYLLNLYCRQGGQIVKAAPSFKPQIVNSDLRLREILSHPFSEGRWRSHYGYMLSVGLARILFFSAEASSNVVGATASLALIVDEAQDVDQDKYSREFRPMASTSAATTVMFGTAWTEDTLLEQQRRYNREVGERTGERLNFEVPWTEVARHNPAYGRFVESEIARLGAEHPTIRTQYCLETVTGGGRLFPQAVLDRVRGGHERERDPDEGAVRYGSYVAGVDVAGQVTEGDKAVLNDRDETVITIAQVLRDAERNPVVRVVDLIHWRGVTHAEQYGRILDVLRRWNVLRACVDATGVGAGLASFLVRACGSEVVDPVVFTTKSKSDLGFELLAAVQTNRYSVFKSDSSDEIREFWRQMRSTRYVMRSSEQMSWSVPESDGHDDYVVSAALCVRAAEAAPYAAAGGVVRAQPTADDSGW